LLQNSAVKAVRSGAARAPGMSKDVALAIVERLGRATARKIWVNARGLGLGCSRSAVSMTLKRRSEMNLLKRSLIGRKRFEYTLAPGGERRLKYKRNSYSGFSEKKEQSPANGVSEELEEFVGFIARAKTMH
jgi:hypothetical protein